MGATRDAQLEEVYQERMAEQRAYEESKYPGCWYEDLDLETYEDFCRIAEKDD